MRVDQKVSEPAVLLVNVWDAEDVGRSTELRDVDEGQIVTAR